MHDNSLRQRWKVLEGRKGDLHTRNEKYARWTLPYLYPCEGTENEELDTDLDSVGARAVNHLSNKLVETLFPTYRPFLKLEFSDEARVEFQEAKVPESLLDTVLVNGEKDSIRYLDKLGHRTAATLAAKYLIVTGNTLLYYPEGEGSKCQTYNTRDYCVMRDLSGNVIEIVTQDRKAFETFTQEVQSTLRAHSKHEQKDYQDGTDVILYTQIKLNEDGKYKVSQAADGIPLEINEDHSYAKKDLPWVPLTWNLARGEDYGRGMVEDYRGAFNAVDVLSQALIEGVISAATLKFLVSPASVLDVEELNGSENGSYHVGSEGDVTAIKSDKHLDFQQVKLVLEDYQRQIGQAFLLASAITRDAERVTAEEIRKDAQEIEMSFGGVYSRFTEDWQTPVANLTLNRIGIKVNEDTVFPTIITGLETLSRLGDLDNYRLYIQDLSLLQSLPEDIRARMRTSDLLVWIGNNRGVDYTKFIKSEQEFQQEQQALQQQQQQMMQQQTGQQMMVDASKAAAESEL